MPDYLAHLNDKKVSYATLAFGISNIKAMHCFYRKTFGGS